MDPSVLILSIYVNALARGSVIARLLLLLIIT